MKSLNTHTNIILMILVSAFIINCKSAQTGVDLSSPFELGQVYYRKTTHGNQTSGINIYVPIVSNPDRLQLLDVFFHGKQTNLETNKEGLMVGHFNMEAPKKNAIIMSSDPYAEYGNQVPKIEKPIPFKLKDNECVVSYKEGDALKFFKIGNIIKK